MTTTKSAIMNDVRLDRSGVVAVCQHRTYDVWGNSRDGYQVNDTFDAGEIAIPAEVSVSNVPRLPGAQDGFRSFPDSYSFQAEVVVTFSLTESAIRKAIGAKCKIVLDGDERTYYVNRERDGYPICELEILRFEEHDPS